MVITILLSLSYFQKQVIMCCLKTFAIIIIAFSSGVNHKVDLQYSTCMSTTPYPELS